METPGSTFLHQRQPNLHASQQVEGTVAYLRAAGEAIPNQPAEKISAYLGFLANEKYVNDGILTGDQASIDRQIELHVIDARNVPEAYFDLQRRIAREQGHGDIQITPAMREQMIESVQADQRAGLAKWIEYLGGEDGGYPDWFKQYTFDSVVKLGNYDKEKSKFLERSKGTTAAYPELNREALAYVYDVLNKARVRGEKVDGGARDEQLQELIKSANFGKLYAHAVLEVTPTSPELRKEVRGSWTKFNRTADPRTARRLSGSLQGYGTTWCTAGESTANTQLKGGDFYVYYTRDEDGKDTIPRIAVRMEDDRVAEVRGIETSQELETEMIDIATERLKTLPGGEAYLVKAQDMKLLTALDKRLAADPSAELSDQELRFLYELDRKIQNFGYGPDPRIDEITFGRNFVADMQKIFGTADHNAIAQQLITLGDQGTEVLISKLADLDNIDPSLASHMILASWRGEEAVARYISNFNGADHTAIAEQLIENSVHGRTMVATYFENFIGVDDEAIAELLISSGSVGAEQLAKNLPKFKGLDHADIARRLIAGGWESVEAVTENLANFTGVDHKDIVEQIFANPQANLKVLARDLPNFKGVDHQDIAYRLIDSGQKGAEGVATYLSNFKGLDHTELANRLIANNDGFYVAGNLEKFEGVNHDDLAKKMMARRPIDVIQNLGKFKGLDSSVAEQLCEYGWVGVVADNTDSFTSLDPEVQARVQHFKDSETSWPMLATGL